LPPAPDAAGPGPDMGAAAASSALGAAMMRRPLRGCAACSSAAQAPARCPRRQCSRASSVGHGKAQVPRPAGAHACLQARQDSPWPCAHVCVRTEPQPVTRSCPCCPSSLCTSHGAPGPCQGTAPHPAAAAGTGGPSRARPPARSPRRRRPARWAPQPARAWRTSRGRPAARRRRRRRPACPGRPRGRPTAAAQRPAAVRPPSAGAPAPAPARALGSGSGVRGASRMRQRRRSQLLHYIAYSCDTTQPFHVTLHVSARALREPRSHSISSLTQRPLTRPCAGQLPAKREALANSSGAGWAQDQGTPIKDVFLTRR